MSHHVKCAPGVFCLLLAGCSPSSPPSVPDGRSELDAVRLDAPSAPTPDGAVPPDGRPAVETTSPETRPVLGCAPAVQVQDEAGLLGLLSQLGYISIGRSTHQRPLLTADVQLAGPVVVGGAKVAVPQTCLQENGCRHQVAFRIPHPIPGATCSQPDEVFTSLGLCGEIRLENVTVRFSGIYLETHPAAWNFVPLVDVVPECAAPCAEGEFRCSANSTCWNVFDEYCRLCLQNSPKTCACRTLEGPLPDYSTCQVWCSGDTVATAKCIAGTCEVPPACQQ